MAKEKIFIDKLKFEKEEIANGHKLIAGVDEVGRGPLAGPVCVACVIMPLDEKILIDGIDDSKKVSEKKREELAAKIKEKAIAYRVFMVEPKVIDEINILQATKLCMKNAIEGMQVMPDIVLVDAIKSLDVSVPVRGIIKGDALSYSIGAASILAKVERDALMKKLAEKYPEYGFERNKGYGTKEHIEALKKFGITKNHRRSFLKFLEGEPKENVQ